MFAELHTHCDVGSNLRLIDATCTVEASINKAVELGFAGMAITDHEALSAHIKAIQTVKKIREQRPDFRLVLGNEIYLIGTDDYKNTNKFWHFILLAKDAVGHRLLRILSSRAWSRVYTHKRVERVPTFYEDLYEVVRPNQGHLIASTACLGSQFDAFILADETGRAWNFVQWCQDVFGFDNFYIEMQPGITDEQIAFNQKAMKFCKTHGVPWIFTNDVHYLTKEKRALHAAFLNSKDEERETGDFYENTYFKSEDEMRERMPYFSSEDIDEGFRNTVRIAQSVEQYDLAHNTVVPVLKPPPFQLGHIFRDWYNSCPSIREFAYSSSEQNRYCLYLCEQGFKEKHQEFSEENLKRIDTEFEQLIGIENKIQQPMAGYYNIVRWIVDLMWDDNQGNSLVGVSRGSAGAFYICYLMGITQINPVQWNLPWWRHLSKERPELPDSFLNFLYMRIIFKEMTTVHVTCGTSKTGRWAALQPYYSTETY